MNIFYVDEDPATAAKCLVDKHVVKMILESAQLLSTAHRILDGVEYEGKSQSGRKARRWILDDGREHILYTATHINHPSAIWCRQSIENYNWLYDHFHALMCEYTHRYGKFHKCYGEISAMLLEPPQNLKESNWSIMPSAMPEEFISDKNTPLTNYRNYYRIGKSNLHKWTKREPPEWINE
jgi:hypothetical protein